MEIVVEKREHVTVVSIDGSVDGTTAPRARRARSASR